MPINQSNKVADQTQQEQTITAAVVLGQAMPPSLTADCQTLTGSRAASLNTMISEPGQLREVLELSPAVSKASDASILLRGNVVQTRPSTMLPDTSTQAHPITDPKPARRDSAVQEVSSPVQPATPRLSDISTQGHLSTVSATALWDSDPGEVNKQALVQTTSESRTSGKPKIPNLVHAPVKSPQIEPLLPFDGSEDMGGFQVPAKPIMKPGLLKNKLFTLPSGISFVDKVLPRPAMSLTEHEHFNAAYYTDLHSRCIAPGKRGQYEWPANTPNYVGARIRLRHTTFNLDSWRRHLIGYESPELVQFLEFGFTLGLQENPVLTPATANHGSAYQYYSWLDKFFAGGLLKGGLTGPYGSSPFPNPMVSPLMTAHKKPSDRRAVFDASFGLNSLNNSTPGDVYMDTKCIYSYPKIEDFQRIILKCGRGCYLWKRDLSRYFLQLPLCPTEYCLTGVVWRSAFFYFTSLMFGLRHSGLNGQRVTDAVSWIQRNLGLDYVAPPQPKPAIISTENRHIATVTGLDPGRPLQFNCINYSDDLAGCETSLHRATASFSALGNLLQELGLQESESKASPPDTAMTYLGVHFDTEKMTMSVPAEKLQEVRAALEVWSKKTTAKRQDLQSILGQLFWISKVVKHSRAFLGRLLQQLRDMKGIPDTKRVTLSNDSRKDILWWKTYLRSFNGVTAMVNDDDILQSLSELMSSPFNVYAGDATLWGGGGWFKDEYWSREFPVFLKPTEIPVHIKEFWTLIASCWLWGDQWSGQKVYLFCDNDSVIDTIVYQKPSAPDMLSLLHEYLYVVCLKKFFPVPRKIDTKSNFLADHISRRYDSESAQKVFSSVGKLGMVRVSVPDHRFKLTAPW